MLTVAPRITLELRRRKRDSCGPDDYRRRSSRQTEEPCASTGLRSCVPDAGRQVSVARPQLLRLARSSAITCSTLSTLICHGLVVRKLFACCSRQRAWLWRRSVGRTPGGHALLRIDFQWDRHSGCLCQLVSFHTCGTRRSHLQRSLGDRRSLLICLVVVAGFSRLTALSTMALVSVVPVAISLSARSQVRPTDAAAPEDVYTVASRGHVLLFPTEKYRGARVGPVPPGEGEPSPQQVRQGTRAGQVGGGGGRQRQGAIPGQHEPRSEDADEWRAADPRRRRPACERGRSRLDRQGTQGRKRAASDPEQHPRLLEDGACAAPT